MTAFIRSLFESVLKTNPYLEFAVITGCLRIRGSISETVLVQHLLKQYCQRSGRVCGQHYAAGD